MSSCMSIHYEDGSYVAIDELPMELVGYDYGSDLVAVWNEVVALASDLDLGDLESFVCSEDTYIEVGDYQEAIEEAVEEGEDERVSELRARVRALLPDHDPLAILNIVRPLVAQLEAGVDRDLAEIVLVDLRAYELALIQAGEKGRRVFIAPF